MKRGTSKKEIKKESYTSLLETKTAWFFLIPAFSDNSDRHLKDLIFGIDAISSAGVKQEDIFLYLDIEKELEAKLESYLNSDIRNITPCKHGNLKDFIDLDEDIYKGYVNTVFFVLGHGTMSGLETASGDFIKPVNLINKIQNNNHIKNSVLFLGQCYSGVFNYLKVKNDDPEKNQLVIVGASDLQTSLSNKMTYNGETWLGNVFYLHLFNWFFYLYDIDGDEKLSILDAYKYTGCHVNDHIKTETDKFLPQYISLHNEKEKLFKKLISVITDREKIKNELNNELFQSNKEDLNKILKSIIGNEEEINNEINKVSKEMDFCLSYFGMKQDVWLLNANQARVIGL